VRCRALLFLWLAPALLAGTAERPKEIRALVDAAPVAPPELAADILIRIVESGRVSDPAWKLELLDQAFHMAGAAKYPVALSAAVARALNTDSDPGVRSRALHAKLDALSLRCRAVSGTLALDRKKAVALFREIPIMRFPAHTCEDAIEESPGIFFETLGQVFAQAFTPQERAKGKHVDFAEEYLGALTSPTQLEPAIRVIADQKLAPDELARLTGALVASIQQLNSDDRTFTAATNSGPINEVLTFADRCRQSGCSPHSLVASFRAYLVRHFQAARCAESLKPDPGGRLAETFNQTLVPLVGQGAVAPITADEMKPVSVGEAAKVYEFWSKPAARKVMADYKLLRFGTEEQQAVNSAKRRSDSLTPFLTVEQRSTPEWQAAAQEFLSRLEQWKQDNDEPAESYFHEVCFMYAGLLDIAPSGSLREHVLHSYIDFLKNSEVEHGSPPEWHLEVSRLMNGATDATSGEISRVKNEMRARGDPVMILLVDVQRTLAAQAPATTAPHRAGSTPAP
jgi:hypothetical protein